MVYQNWLFEILRSGPIDRSVLNFEFDFNVKYQLEKNVYADYLSSIDHDLSAKDYFHKKYLCCEMAAGDICAGLEP